MRDRMKTEHQPGWTTQRPPKFGLDNWQLSTCCWWNHSERLTCHFQDVQDTGITRRRMFLQIRALIGVQKYRMLTTLSNICQFNMVHTLVFRQTSNHFPSVLQYVTSYLQCRTGDLFSQFLEMLNSLGTLGSNRIPTKINSVGWCPGTGALIIQSINQESRKW